MFPPLVGKAPAAEQFRKLLGPLASAHLRSLLAQVPANPVPSDRPAPRFPAGNIPTLPDPTHSSVVAARVSRSPVMRKDALLLLSWIGAGIWIAAAPPRCGAG
ncbi:MAG: hypothetical protein JO112_01365 [Planctomycetes bacterium]|nr:hypothetical protein [Planctomycetota bacterium]